MSEDIALSMTGWQGVQLHDAPQIVPPHQLREATNVIYGNQGQIIRRDGYSIYGGAAAGEGRYLLTFHAIDVDEDYLVFVKDSDGYVYALNIADLEDELILQTDTASTTVAMSSSAVRKYYPKAHAVLMDKLFLADWGGTYMWDGVLHTANNDSWVKITDYTLNGGGTVGTPEFPHCRTLAVWADRMVAGNCLTAAGQKHYSRLHFSGVNTPWTWAATDFIDVNPEDGGQIQKIVTYGNQIVVFKDYAVYTLIGGTSGDPADLSLYKIHSLIGVHWSPLSVAQSESLLFWFDPDQGVFAYDGAQVVRIDQDLDNLLVQAAQGSHQVAYGWVHDGRYYLSLDLEDKAAPTVDDEPDTTYVYDIRTGGWSKWTVGWRCLAQHEEYLYAVGMTGGVSGIARVLNGDLTDGATDFSWAIKTAWVPPIGEQGFEPWRVHRMRTWMRGSVPAGSETGEATITLYRDYDDSEAWRTITFDTEKDSDEIMAIGDFSAPADLVSAMSWEIGSDQQVDMELFGLSALFSRRERQKGVEA